MKKNNLQKGQSLYELVVAIGISALIIVGVVSLATSSIQNSTYSKNQSLATAYAQEATEWLRGQRDASITNFLANAAHTPWCLQAEPPTWPGSSGGCGSIDFISGTTLFKRYVNFIITSPSGKTQIEADVIVSWVDAKGTHQVTNSTNFSDWRQR
jgi:type II secretory pathway pseudopilin PulG